MKTRQQSIYAYSELTGSAKERARAWLIEGTWENTQEQLTERFQEILSSKGFPKAEIAYSLNHVQGDGVTFDVKHLSLRGWLEAQGLVKKFQGLYNDDSLNIRVQNSGRHLNPPRVTVEPNYSARVSELEEAIQESIDDVCRQMTREGYEIVNFCESDAELEELAEMNDYEFDEKGRPA